MKPVPTKARAVIIGGGVSGCSLAYHLGKLGWRDVVLLERKQLTCGTTWHAAGLVGQLRTSSNMTRLAKYTADLYAGLEAETGLATGLRQLGSISVALSDERKEELYRSASMARAYGVDVEEISPAEVKDRYPHLNTSDVVGAVFIAKDGQVDPANVTQALAKGARQNGVRIIENAKVTAIHTVRNRVSGVSAVIDGEPVTIEAEHVVNCAGMWAREVGAMAGVPIPLHACEHFYIVTEPVEGLKPLPVLRVPDECAYYKEDAGKMMLGAFEPKAKPWGMGGIREDFCFDQLPEDFDHFEPILELAVKRMPLLAETGIHTFFNGPESFSPDNRYYLGEAPQVRNFWVACGYNSTGIQSSGGSGMALAQWMNDGEPPFDLWDVDIRRVVGFQANRTYLRERVSETLGLLYADHFPYRQPVTSRGVRRSPLHEHLKARGAVFGETAGWERANWFANEDQEREYRYSWKRQNWFDNNRAEHLAVRNGVGLFDMTSFGKIRVEGRDAMAFLQRVCANQMDVAPGRIVYTQMLNPRGGIESDLTAVRIAEDHYRLFVGTSAIRRDLAWLSGHADGFRVKLTDSTELYAVLGLMGPRAAQIASDVGADELNALRYFEAGPAHIAGKHVRATRLSYVGEAGWEITCKAENAGAVWQALHEAGARPAGLLAQTSMRIEKRFLAYGHDLDTDTSPLHAGLGFAIGWDTDFIGRDALLAQRDRGVTNRIAAIVLDDATAVPLGNEPVLLDGEIIGKTTSAAFGHRVGKPLALADFKSPDAMVEDAQVHVDIAGTRWPGRVTLKPAFDPEGTRMKS